MAPLPPESTARYIVHYSQGGNEHTQVYRVSGPTSPSAMETFLDDLWTAIAANLLACTITGVGFIADGSTIENPVSMPTFVGQTYGSGAGSTVQGTGFINFVGRSTGGRRVRLAFFGSNVVDETFRIDAAADSDVADAINDLQTNTVDLCAIDGLEILWKPYVNFGYNAHWQRAKRS